MLREWTSEQLRNLADARELHVSAPRAGATPRAWVPIWVVVVDDSVFVRRWYRRETGWYGRAVASGEAWVRVAGDPVQVRVTAVGPREADAVDAAYRSKYGTAAASSMVTDEAAASTLLLTPASDPDTSGADTLDP